MMKLLNNKGMSLLSVVSVAAVLGVGSVAIFKMIEVRQKNSISITKELNIVSFSKYLSGQTRQLFLDTEDSKKRNTQGMCKFITLLNSDPIETSNRIRDIKYRVLNPKMSKLFSSKRWSKYFEGFKASKNSECSAINKYGACFEIDKSSKNANLYYNSKELDQLRPVIQIDIKAIETNPIAAKPFSEIVVSGKEEQLDLKGVGYEYKLTVYYNKGGSSSQPIRKSYNLKGFVWAGEMNVCDTAGFKIAVVGTGFGSTKSGVVYASPGFLDSKSKIKSIIKPIEIIEEFTNIQSGKIDNAPFGDQSISTDIDNNSATSVVFSSCNERRYLCPQYAKTTSYKDTDRDYSELSQSFGIKYNKEGMRSYYSKAALPSTLKISPSVSFRNTSKEISLAGTKYDTKFTFQSSANGKKITYNRFKNKIGYRYYISGTQTYTPGTKKLKNKGNELVLKQGKIRNITLKVFDSINKNKFANNICRQVCTQSSSYNRANISDDPYRLNIKTRVFPSFPGDIGAVPNSFSMDTSSPIACTACYTKNCQRFGLGTFGKMNNTPTEPSDARIPECVVHEKNVMDNGRRFDKITNNDILLGAASKNKCIAFKLTKSGFDYSVRPCNTKLNVMCFNYGKHFIAKKINGMKLVNIKKSFSDAEDICFDTGREVVQNSSMKDQFIQEGSSNYTGNKAFLLDKWNKGRKSYVNLAQQGTFLAPIGPLQEEAARQFASKGQGVSLTDKYFWVNLRTDNAGYVYAPAPQVSEASKSEKWSLIWSSENSRLLASEPKYTAKPFDSPNSNNAAMLFHDVRHKGIYFVANDKTYEITKKNGSKKMVPHRYLCEDSNGVVFLSSAKDTTQASGEGICINEGGSFVPPTSTAQWITALHKTTPLANDNALPDNLKINGPVWIALKKVSGKVQVYTKYDLTLLTGSNTLADGTTANKYLQNDGAYFVEPAPVEISPADLTATPPVPAVYKALVLPQIKKICINKSTARINIDTGCGSNQTITLSELNLIKGNNGSRLLKIELIKALAKLEVGGITYRLEIKI